VGTSTLAVNLSVLLAQSTAAGSRVILTEFRNGPVALTHLMGLTPQPGLQVLSDLQNAPPDADTVLSHIDLHSTGVMVLGGSPDALGKLPAPSTSRAAAIVRRISEVPGYVLIDMGTGLGNGNQEFLNLLRFLVVVTEPHHVALLHTRDLLDGLDALAFGRHKVGLVLVRKTPSANTMTKQMVEGFLGRELTSVVPPAPDLACHAAEKGIPMVLIQTDTVVYSQFQQLAKFIGGL
jgi:MinD-like ATPase involved in chromosome partitioning or flagellar assembly